MTHVRRSDRSHGRWLATTALGSAALLLAACGGGVGGGGATSDAATLKIGFVTTDTGPFADFGAANDFIIKQMKSYFASHPIKANGKSYKVQIFQEDSQSNTTRAGQVTSDLINKDNVSMVFAAGTTVDVSASEQCEANQVPCLTSVLPWQPFAIRGTSKTPVDLKWSHHFFWGLEDVAKVYQNIWKAVPNNGQAAALFPNDSDGAAWAANLPGLIKGSGVTLHNPGAYTDGTQDFSAQLSKFKSEGDQIITGLPIPPDFTTFWKQAAQQGFRPKVATIGKGVLFPESVNSVGKIGNNIGTEVWWTPDSPFKSSLTGQSAKSLADAYEASTGKEWTQPLGFSEALFEVAAAALKKAGSTDPAKLNAALNGLSVDTIVGKVSWGSDKSVPPYVAKTPVAGGQWRYTPGAKYPFKLEVVENSLSPETPLESKPKALTW